MQLHRQGRKKKEEKKLTKTLTGKNTKRVTDLENLPWSSWWCIASLAHSIMSPHSWLRTCASSGRKTDLEPSAELSFSSAGMFTEWQIWSALDKRSCGCTKGTWSDCEICFTASLHVSCGSDGLLSQSCSTALQFCKCRLLRTTPLWKLADAAGFLSWERKPLRVPAETWPSFRRARNWCACGESAGTSFEESALKGTCCQACKLQNFLGFKSPPLPLTKISPWSKTGGLPSPSSCLWPDALFCMFWAEPQLLGSKSSILKQALSPSTEPEWRVAGSAAGWTCWVASLCVAGGNVVEAGEADCADADWWWVGEESVMGMVTTCKLWMHSSMASFSSSSM